MIYLIAWVLIGNPNSSEITVDDRALRLSALRQSEIRALEPTFEKISAELDTPGARLVLETLCNTHADPRVVGLACAELADHFPVKSNEYQVYARRGCDAGEPLACIALSESKPQQVGVVASENERLLRRACHLEKLLGCTHLAVHRFQARIATTKDMETLVSNCDDGDSFACYMGSFFLSFDRRAKRDDALASRLAKRACASGWKSACRE